jgi:hypothetical protein
MTTTTTTELAVSSGRGSGSADDVTILRQRVEELLDRAEVALMAIFDGSVEATEADTWTLQGFRSALTWVLSFMPEPR